MLNRSASGNHRRTGFGVRDVSNRIAKLPDHFRVLIIER
jgi:hypothetical protein